MFTCFSIPSLNVAFFVMIIESATVLDMSLAPISFAILWATLILSPIFATIYITIFFNKHFVKMDE
jgi:hypothetical protein